PVQGDGRVHQRRRRRRGDRQHREIRHRRKGFCRSRLQGHPAHPAVSALRQRRDAEERLGISILVPPPARLPRAGEGVTSMRGISEMLVCSALSPFSEGREALSLSPPLRGPRRAKLALEGGERGSGNSGSRGLPLSTALPRKGGGSAVAPAAAFFLIVGSASC